MRKDSKLIHLMKIWPQGAVLTSQWLIHEKNYSKSLLQKYHSSGWIDLIGKGAYRKAAIDESENDLQSPPDLKWHGGVYALQALNIKEKWKLQTPPVIVSARTALEIRGKAHYLNMSARDKVWLFVAPNYRIPSWFKKYDWQADIRTYSTKLFPPHLDEGLSVENWGSYKTVISSSERAIMEVLELCPKYETLEHTKLLMEGLGTLRPKVSENLLLNCNSIKVKRLFLALADVCGHKWIKKIDLGKINLGSGKRILEPGHGYHQKFMVSVPKENK